MNSLEYLPKEFLVHNYNRQNKLSNDGGSLSSDTGELIFREFDEKIGFSKTLTRFLQLKDERHYYFHSNENLLHQKIYQMIAGYSEDDAADQLTKDAVFTQVIGADALASQPSLSRFFARFNHKAIEQLNQSDCFTLNCPLVLCVNFGKVAIIRILSNGYFVVALTISELDSFFIYSLF